MEIKQIEFSPEFEKDLETIFLLLKQYSTIKKAEEQMTLIFDKVELLRDFPFMGQKEFNLSKKHKIEYRYLVAGNYKLYYRILGEMVFIARIFDTRQNPKKLKI